MQGGIYPLIIKTKKKQLIFQIKPSTHPHKPKSWTREKAPFVKLVRSLTDQTAPSTVQTQPSTAFQPPIKVNQIIKLTKDAYLEHWTNQPETQNKLAFRPQIMYQVSP